MHVPKMFVLDLGDDWPSWCLANASYSFAWRDGDQGVPVVPKVENV